MWKTKTKQTTLGAAYARAATLTQKANETRLNGRHNLNSGGTDLTHVENLMA